MDYCRKLSEVRGSVLLAEREGVNKKGSVLENAVNIQTIIINKNKCSVSNCVCHVVGTLPDDFLQKNPIVYYSGP